MSLVAHFDMELEKLDVKTTFLHVELEEIVYMVHLEGFHSTCTRTLGLQIEEIIIWDEVVPKAMVQEIRLLHYPSWLPKM